MRAIGGRINFRWVLWLTAGVVVAMQFVLSAQACVLPGSMAAAAVAAADCAGMAMGDGACLIKCQKTADQVKPSVDFHFHVLPVLNSGAHGLPLPRAVPATAAVSATLPRSVGPPLQILFCSFQT